MFEYPEFERLRIYRKLLARAEWEPKVLPITPLTEQERETVLHRLQTAYMQRRLLQSRGDL
jgi:hypothetical protein